MHNLGEYRPVCINCQKISQWRRFFKTYSLDRAGSCEGCGGPTVPLDSLFIPIAKILWKKGYRTTYSCMGHYKKDTGFKSIPYVGFDQDYEFSSIPVGWKKEQSVIRFKGRDYKKAVKAFLEWAKQIPRLDQRDRPVTSVSFSDKKYHEEYILFFGRRSADKNLKKHYPDFKKVSSVSELNKENRVVIDSRKIDKLMPYFGDKKVIIVFEMNKDREKNWLPTGIYGWGAFSSKKDYYLYTELIQSFPVLLTGDSNEIYQIRY